MPPNEQNLIMLDYVTVNSSRLNKTLSISFLFKRAANSVAGGPGVAATIDGQNLDEACGG